MTQPPPGGFPPPEQNPSGGQPPAAGQPPAGPPPGAPAGPPPGAPAGPPPGYTPPAGAPAGPPPGYTPPAGGYPPPPAGQQGYPPPPQGQPGYPPPGQPGYPQQGRPGYPPPGGYPGQPAAPGSSIDLSKVSIGDWGLLGAALLYLIFSFMTWQLDLSAFLGWHSGWGSWYIIPTLLVLAILIIKGLKVFVPSVNLTAIKAEFVFYGAALAAVLVLIACIVILASDGFMYFAAWADLICALGVAFFAAVDAQKSGAKLPFTIPVPANF